MAGPAATASRWPVAPQVQGSPAASGLGRWPRCPATPAVPWSSRPEVATAPPTPVPTAAYSRTASPGSVASSVAAAARTSLSQATGSPVRAARPGPSAVPAQSARVSVALTTVPAAGSITPAAATPIAVAPAAPTARAAAARASRTAAGPRVAGVGSVRRARTVPSGATRAAAILVPPRSRPTTGPGWCGAVIGRGAGRPHAAAPRRGRPPSRPAGSGERRWCRARRRRAGAGRA